MLECNRLIKARNINCMPKIDNLLIIINIWKIDNSLLWLRNLCQPIGNADEIFIDMNSWTLMNSLWRWMWKECQLLIIWISSRMLRRVCIRWKETCLNKYILWLIEALFCRIRYLIKAKTIKWKVRISSLLAIICRIIRVLTFWITLFRIFLTLITLRIGVCWMERLKIMTLNT
jgi:hypothetical protein